MADSPFGRGRPSRQPPPNQGGEYRIRDAATGKLRYIGETNNLARRRNEHVRSKKLREGADIFEWKSSRPDSTSSQRRSSEQRQSQ